MYLSTNLACHCSVSSHNYEADTVSDTVSSPISLSHSVSQRVAEASKNVHQHQPVRPNGLRKDLAFYLSATIAIICLLTEMTT